MKRKMVVLVLLMVLLLPLTIFATGQKEKVKKKEKQPVKLSALFIKQASYSEQDVRNMTAEFEKENPLIRISLEFVSYEALHDKIIAAAASGSGYDVILIDVIWPAEFAAQGILRDITKEIPKSMLDKVFSGAWDTVLYKGRYYGIPWILDTEYLFYNKEMLKKAGISAPPKTLNDMVDQAKIIKNKGIVKYPIIWAWQQSENVFLNYVVLVAGFGGSFFDANGNPLFNSGGGLKALEYMVQSLKDGVSNPASLQAISDDELRVFGSGQAAFALNWTYMYSIANTDSSQSKVVGQVGVVPTPGDGEHVQIASVNGSMGLGITQSSKNPKEALKYIEYLTSSSVEAKYANLSLPMWKSFYEEPSKWPKGQKPLINAAKLSFAKLYNRPMLAHYTQFSTIMQKYLQKALLYQMSPKDALDAAAKEIVQEKANN